jgi:formamidopyrimidine-DNA glycosylase
MVMHLARGGWLRWRDSLPGEPTRPGKGPLAFRVRLDDGSGFDLTEAGTRKRLAVHVVRDPQQVPAIASLGPDPLDPAFDREALATILRGRRTQVKGLLRQQSVLAGVGNAYSDEVLHVARLSPYALAATLTDDEVDRLYAALRGVLTEAVATSWGKPAAELKDAKRSAMRVHGRTGQPCPVCGDTVREVSFADSSLQYCPTCQTGGKPLADRRLSRLLK